MSISYLQQAAVGGITTPDNAEEQKTEAEAGYSAGNVSLHTDTRLQVVLHQKMVRREGNVSEAQNQQRHNAQITVRKLMKILANEKLPRIENKEYEKSAQLTNAK